MLKAMEITIGEEVVVRILERCLPKEILEKWIEQVSSDRYPKLEQLYTFIQNSVFKQREIDKAPSVTHPNKRPGGKNSAPPAKMSKPTARSLVTTSTSSNNSCPKCGQNHRLYSCEEFKKSSMKEKWDFVYANKLCRNCLGAHPAPYSSKIRCKKKDCGRDHHTFLHTNKKQKGSASSKPADEAVSSGATQKLLNSCQTFSSQAYLSDSQLMTTAVLNFQSNRGKGFMARSLLDSCSNANSMTQSFLHHLKLPTKQCFVNIGAIDNASTVSEKYTNATFYSNYNNSKHQLNFLIVPKIADRVPNETFPRERFGIPKNVKLADPQFHVPRPINVLLVSGTTLSSLAIGQIKLTSDNSQITLQKTAFGWVVAGRSSSTKPLNTVSCNAVKLDQLLERFMAIEDIDYQPVKAQENVACENYYVETTTRDASGRYTVRLPFQSQRFELGSSKRQALQRFKALERKFDANPDFRAQYEKEINSYLELGHMTSCEDDADDGYYMPHHAVIKESSETTKCRVVFDASAETSTRTSLNKVLLTGPTLQETIPQQSLRFRAHPFVITADIEKMYRQIWVHPDDRKFQKILWYHEGKIRTFHINVVTFGVTCAPFLAIRTLHQLASDEEVNSPRDAQLLRRDFYVDDFLSGANSLDEIMAIRDEMIELLSRGGFVIRIWSSNHPSALDNIDKRIFDLDCGIQVLIQDCWRAKLTWDESLLQNIHTKWIDLAGQLPSLESIAIPRNLRCGNPVSTEIHGFCYASLNGYGACIFVRSADSLGNVTVRLACSKSEIASMSHQTIPRLELAGATLLKKLYVEAREQLIFLFERVMFWSDSMIVLCWLKKAPHLLRTYESNRVAEIRTLGDEAEWRHIRSGDNPADSLSRGCKEGLVLFTAASGSTIYSRFSEYGTLIRSFAYLLRWKMKGKNAIETPKTNRSRRGIRYLSPDEIANAEIPILLLIQRESFSPEIKLLKSNKKQNSNNSTSSFRSQTKFDELNPFLDDNGLIRVGGRLKKSDLLFNQKYPIYSLYRT
ncbi:uncharacterized protein LOC117170768 [Belonocnema kinseyi]|uniref:uncharacterized protein LOC117170768 n=1 Tax=Belonocnema kinseyi TaxID=2817044 RepID=UPI00143CE6E4|nr:uncharacterized protein LOC117170768 [Belonocnema kinseyi]